MMSLEKITLPNLGDLVKILRNERQGIVVDQTRHDLGLGKYYCVDCVDALFHGGESRFTFWLADELQVIETAQYRAEKVLGEEYF